MVTNPRVAALRALASRRLTEAQLWKKLDAQGFSDDAIAQAVASCKRDGYLDDRLYATLYIEGPRRAVGDARIVAELIKRGISREIAQSAVTQAPADELARIRAAYSKMRRTKPSASYQSIARGLERLGFPTSLIYRVLREEAAAAIAGSSGFIDEDVSA
jgi:regulatory protein